MGYGYFISLTHRVEEKIFQEEYAEGVDRGFKKVGGGSRGEKYASQQGFG